MCPAGSARDHERERATQTQQGNDSPIDMDDPSINRAPPSANARWLRSDLRNKEHPSSGKASRRGHCTEAPPDEPRLLVHCRRRRGSGPRGTNWRVGLPRRPKPRANPAEGEKADGAVAATDNKEKQVSRGPVG